MKISNQEFADIWQGSQNVGEVAERTGLRRHYCIQKASRLRLAGNTLKMFPTGPAPTTPRVTVLDPEEAREKLDSKQQS